MKVQCVSIMFRVLFTLLLFGAVSAHASVITVAGTHAGETYYKAGNADTAYDLLRVRPANASGISWNTFSTFDVSARSLNIVNVGGRAGADSDAATTPASLIIIEAPDISLANRITLMGAAADILFIATNTAGDVVCNSCSFENFYRVTLSAARPAASFADAMSGVGNLTTTTGGAVSINGLSAPGALSLDILGRDIDVSGEINLHQKASKDSRGGYTLNPNGSFTLGTGGVNLLLGQLDWHYESQESVRFYPQGSQQTLGGSIKAVAAKLSSSEAVTVNTSIDTRTDVLSSVRYRNSTYVNTEAVTLQTIGSQESSNWLVYSGTLDSNGEVRLASIADLTVHESATISAPKTNLIAREDLFNFGRVESDEIGLASDTVLNRGELESFTKMEIWAQKNVVNNFGGVIIGPDVAIESVQGIVRNGSRYPYLVNTNYLDFQEYQDVNDVDGFDAYYGYYYSYSYDITNDRLNAGIVSADNYDEAHIGTFYRSDMRVDTQTARVQPENTSALLLAENLRIKASAVENINPYWEVVEPSGSVTVDAALVAQVEISGTNSITIDASNYVLNSSAMMRTESPTGLMKLKTRTITNERYRTLNTLEKIEGNSSGSGTSSDPLTENILGFYTRTATYSPPGFLIAMGGLHLDAPYGAFYNNQSYFEVFGNAHLNAPTIRDIGLKHDGVVRTDTTVYDQAVLSCLNMGGKWKSLFLALCGDSTPTTTEVTIPDVAMSDSLFFIHGNVYGTKSSFDSTTYNAFNHYVDMAANNAMYRDYRLSEGNSTVADYNPYGYTEVVTSNNFNSLVDGDRLLVTNTQSVTTSVGYCDPLSYGACIRVGDPVSSTTNQTREFSLVAELEKIWETVKTWFTSLLAEFDWWS